MKNPFKSPRWLGAGLLALASSVPAFAVSVQVTIENLAPSGGTFLTPVWVGFHDGTFDLYDSGSAAGASLERLAEDGSTSSLSAAFALAATGGVDGTIASGGPIAPGASVSQVFSLNAVSGMNSYFSYASMVIPSNDAFIANGNPMAFSIFNGGAFQSVSFVVTGGMVLDAGTEVNDEVPAHTAFFGQAVPNTGTTENGVVGIHGGFRPVADGGILADAMFQNADFTGANYQVARITLSQVPEPAESAMVVAAALGIGTCIWRRRRGAVSSSHAPR